MPKRIFLLLFLASCQIDTFLLQSLNLEQEKYDERQTVTAFILAQGLLQSHSVPCTAYDFGLPARAPMPLQSPANCGTPDRVQLGRLLFYDKRLSGDESMSCASCHRQEFAFSDRKAQPRGIAHDAFPTGELHPRNSQQLSNVGYNITFTWANSTQLTLEAQGAGPLFAESGPSTIVELGFNSTQLAKIQADATYQTKFAAAYPGLPVDEVGIRRALSVFQRSMHSFQSSFDKYFRGTGTMSASAVRGFHIFNGETAECFHCHGGFNFSDSTTTAHARSSEFLFHNNGLYTAAEYAAKPMRERGLIDVTGKQQHEGLFKAPSLRNVALTFPYMHDGSFACDGAYQNDDDACARNALGKVIDHYQSGGKAHPTKDATLIRPFTLSAQEREDLIEFLISLTDQDFISRENLSNPFPANPLFGP